MANRYICCNDCYKDKSFSQSRWREQVEKYGSSQKFKRNYICASCRALRKKNPMVYHLKYGDMMNRFRKDVRGAYKIYHKSERTRNDLISLQSSINEIFSNLEVKKWCPSLDYVLHTERKGDLIKLDGITFQNFPFVGDHYVAFCKKRRKTYWQNLKLW